MSRKMLCLTIITSFTVSSIKEEKDREKRIAILAATELPAASIDLSEFNLTELVNGMFNKALNGTKKFFSFLSVTSYSSFAFHKVSILIYNISNLKNVDPGKFPMRYCYCLNNRTNDLTDFTALLLDIIGNSTSYLKEIFKSTSIVSVSQSNETDCIYLCVLTGRTGRNLSDLWELTKKSPVINYTFSGTAFTPVATRMPSWAKPLAPDRHEVSTTNIQPEGPVVALIEHASTSSVFLGAHGQPSHENGAHSMGIGSWAKGVASKGREISVTKLPLWVQGIASDGREISSTGTTSWTKTVAQKGDDGSYRTFPSWTLERHKIDSPGAPSWTQDAKSEAHELSSAGGPSWTETVDPKGFDISSTKMPTLVRDTTLKEPETPLKMEPPWTLSTVQIHDNLSGMHIPSRCSQANFKEIAVTSPSLMVIIQIINPCVMELCRFFQQCLCVSQRGYARIETIRYCIQYYSWYLNHATYICLRVKRISYTYTLKQKCLANICKSI
ncbi:HERV-H LTR-associating protein 1 [Microcaecilia unicolor]|uniref:HERV-H LTR-associating protein 1 n=1 Tax=Microcaecilia unicolor TaxID=1415580 RepID=A0A6P7X6L5_9AMPH|nr:HERV-H LTR-associating protein 1 [Microcaecilia unicolor]